MSSLVIYFIVTIAVIIPKNVVGNIAFQDIDVDRLIDMVQQGRINPQYTSDSTESDDSEESETSDYDLARTGRVGSDNFIDIISQVVNSKNNKQGNYDRVNRMEMPSHVERPQKYSNRNTKNGDSQRASVVAQILEQLLNRSLKDAESKWQPNNKTFKKRLTPNRLVGDVRNKNADDDLENYSKIYILLNPQAVQRSKFNKNSINKLISKILSLSSSSPRSDQTVKPKSKRYKGFAIRGDNARRRGSREMYGSKDSGDERPKRNRNTASAGHTAIPYIRHRGENIYEREN